ncbi:family 43 glycosylhydrolase [Roseovarius pacificus]|uniref:family 43 glycosylhydrolase n=1 Tax=Roseovarius pacificus TaxID=337701 RepID=UPI002A18B92D|nr:family 43 glycosylhydrolase [Roseovarius pacificus]
MFYLRAAWLFLAATFTFLMPAVWAAPNPVLPNTADVGVLRFGGEYYLMGMGTSGAVYRSRDLVSWRGPTHAFSMNNDWTKGEAAKDHAIHACNLRLVNGQFHLYWSVNEGELRQIGHATAREAVGPYAEPVTDGPFDGRIDPDLFMDEDSELYLYTTKFNRGNAIWGQRLRDPWTLEGEAAPLLTARKDTWEWRDHPVNEAEEVVRHHRRYYMLFNANHTHQRYGNYAIGVAESGEPLGFSNDSKYGFPVLTSNRERLLTTYDALVPVAVSGTAATWAYTETPPPPNWFKTEFDDAAWIRGLAGFGDVEHPPGRGHVQTARGAGGLWLRHAFAPEKVPTQAALWLFSEAPATVWLNGVVIADAVTAKAGYRSIVLDETARGLLKAGGPNLLAVHVAGPGYADAGLYDTGDRPGEPIVHNPGQANLVRGPNGFEWWLVYFALYNGSPARSQAIDRVCFFGDELVVDGPTTAATPGYHPLPAAPTFIDTFDDPRELETRWIPGRGQWQIRDGRLEQYEAQGFARIQAIGEGGKYFMFECAIRFPEGATEQAGCATSDLVFGLDPGRKTGFFLPRFRNESNEKHFPLPADFDWAGWHTLRLECNGLQYRTWLDGVDTGKVMGSGVYSPVRPEFFARGPAMFDGAVYTRGWDGVGDLIDDWGHADCGTPQQGRWVQRKSGLLATPPRESVSPAPGEAELPAFFHEEAHAFKGDLLDHFEWAAQVVPRTHGEGAELGLYALYADETNWLRVAVDAHCKQLTVTGTRDGKPLAKRNMPLCLRVNRRYSTEENGVNLRIAKLPGEVVVLADGTEHLRIAGDWPRAQVGLFTLGTSAYFRGVVLYDRSGGESIAPVLPGMNEQAAL